MIGGAVLILVAALAATSAIGGMALYAARIAAFPGSIDVTRSERIQLYVGAVLTLALMGQVWSQAAHVG